jgi:cytochrome c-type biogenesis protein
MDVSIALAFAAGLLSFISPCVLALVPVYLAFLGETASASNAAAPDASTAVIRRQVLGQAVLFVLGFGAFFVLVGMSVGLVGQVLLRTEIVRQVAGVAVIGIGILTTGIFGPVFERMSMPMGGNLTPGARPMRAFSLGALVAIGWTPCIGPVLGAILTMGASSADVWVAALLLVAYSAGLAVPFLAAALALPRMRPLINGLRRHHRAVQVVSGLFIIGIGLLIFTNAFTRMASLFQIGL